jgi:hypothetical protein
MIERKSEEDNRESKMAALEVRSSLNAVLA